MFQKTMKSMMLKRFPCRQRIFVKNPVSSKTFCSAAATATVPMSSLKTEETKSDAVEDAFRLVNKSRQMNPNNVMNDKLNDFEKLIVEAKLSINDCAERYDDEEDTLIDEDREAAKDAVGEAIAFFSDLNYDVQKGEKEMDDKTVELVKTLEVQLDQLKTELDAVLGETKRGNVLLGLDNIMNKIMNWRS